MKATQRRLVLLVILAVFVLLSSRTRLETASTPPQFTIKKATLSAKDLATIQSDISRLQLAIFKADYQTVLELAHPHWIKAIGGDESVRKEVESLGDLAASLQFEFEQPTFRDEPTVFQTSKHEFAIVPSICVYKGQDEQIELPTYDLAVRRLGIPHWKYVGGSELNEQQAIALFPDLPKDLRFPPKVARPTGK